MKAPVFDYARPKDVAEASGGISGLIERGAGGSPVSRAFRIWKADEPSNGTVPVIISNSTAPRLYWSLAVSAWPCAATGSRSLDNVRKASPGRARSYPRTSWCCVLTRARSLDSWSTYRAVLLNTRNIGMMPLDVPFVTAIYDPVARIQWTLTYDQRRLILPPEHLPSDQLPLAES